jgi:hypothetical protein
LAGGFYWASRLFFPQLGSVVHKGLKTAFTATGGSLGFS